MGDVLKYADLAVKVITPIGVVALLLLQGQFVSRKEFADSTMLLSGRMETMEKVLIEMKQGAITDARHDKELADHESRLRDLEKHERIP